MSDAALIDYYANTLLLQYVTKPKAYATIQAAARAIMVNDLLIAIRDGYNVHTAVGVQLDILGKYAGIGRQIIGFVSSGTYFGFLEYGEAPPKDGISGFISYEMPDGGGVRVRSYADANALVYLIPDDQYRGLIQMKIFKNHSNGSLESIDAIMQALFGEDYLVSDGGDMVLHYIFPESASLLVSIARYTGLLPKPTGVGLSVGVTPDLGAIFGFAQYGVDTPTRIIGLREYGETSAGGMVQYG